MGSLQPGASKSEGGQRGKAMARNSVWIGRQSAALRCKRHSEVRVVANYG